MKAPLVERFRDTIARFGLGWPQGYARATRDMADWPSHWINWAFQVAADFTEPVQAFLETPSVNHSLRRVLRDVGQTRVRVWQGRGKGRKEIERTGRLVDEGGNLADLLNYANPLYTGRQLRQSLVGSRILSGNAYMHCQQFRGPRKPPSELWSYAGHLTRPVPGPNRTIIGYEYQKSGQGEWVSIEGGVVIQFAGYNPKDEPIGLSDLKAATNAYLTEFYALQWARDFFKRGAVIPGIWSWEEGRAPKGANSDQAVKEFQAMIARRFGSNDNRWAPVIVDGIKYAAAGMKLSEMELDTQLGLAEAKVLDALGLPTKKDGQETPEERAAYWLGPIKDHCDLLADVMTERLAPFFGKDQEIEFSLDHVLAVQNARLEQAKTHYLLAGGIAIETPNEARDAINLPERPEPEADTLYQKPVPQPLDMGAAPDARGDSTDGNAGEAPRPAQKPARNRLSVELADKRQKAAGQLARFSDSLLVICTERLAGQRRKAVAMVKEWHRKYGQHLSNGSRKTSLDALDVSNLIPPPDDQDEARFRRALARIVAERGADAIKDLERMTAVQLEIEFDITSERAARFIAEQANRATSIPDETTRELLQKNLAQAVEDGGSLEQLLDAVHETFDARRNQALTIARTESLSAYNWASSEAWQQTGVVDKQEWLTSRSGLGGRHSEDPDGHYAASDGGLGLDGQVRAIGEAFDVGGVRMFYPGDPGAPPGEVCNCYLPGTLVSGAFVAGIRSPYSGQVREVVTKRGNRLRVTANHPVLTSKGWLPAHALNRGDYLVRDSREVVSHAPVSEAHEQHVPVSIEQVYESLRVHGSSRQMHLRSEDLHRDARFVLGEVEIVAADRKLRLEPNAAGRTLAHDLGFVQVDVQASQVSRERAALHSLGGVLLAASPAPHPGHLLLHSRSVDADLRPLDTQLIAYSADLHAALDEVARQGDADEPLAVGDVLERFPGTVALDQVVEVRDFDWSGHVYDLQSTTGAMVADGIIAHNCVCTLLPVINEAALANRVEAIRLRKALSSKPVNRGDAPVPSRIASFFEGWTR